MATTTVPPDRRVSRVSCSVMTLVRVVREFAGLRVVVAALFVLVALGEHVAFSATTPPQPSAGYGMPAAQVWGPGDYDSAGLNPLNSAGASSDGSGGTSSCTNTPLLAEYSFNILENYEQLVTFFPDSCTQLKAVVNNMPSSSLGALYEYSTSAGRISAIKSVPHTLSSSMVLFQPALDAFSIYDADRTPVVNTSLVEVVFQLTDTSLGTTLPTTTNTDLTGSPVGARIGLWVLWQNQPPTASDIDITTMDTAANLVITLGVSDPDVDGANSIAQTLTAYVATLPTGGSLYQYAANATLYRGALITAAYTTVTDAAFRVVLAVSGTGRPYATFTYSADDSVLDSVVDGVVTVDVLVADTSLTASNQTVHVDENSSVLLQLRAKTSPSAYLSLVQCTITSLPEQGSLYQASADGSIGDRLVIVPAPVTNTSRYLWFQSYPDTSGTSYALVLFTCDDGVQTSNVGRLKLDVDQIDLAPYGVNVSYTSLTGSDVLVRLIGLTEQPGSSSLTAVITSLPALGTLSQLSGTAITSDSLPCAVADTTSLMVIYTPEPNPSDTSVVKRYTESFLYQISDSGLLSVSPNSVTIQVGSEILPPIVYSQDVSTSQNTSLIIQLNGTAPNADDTWTPYITKLPTYGTLYQMSSGVVGAQITSSGSTPVTDHDFNVLFVPYRFSPINDSFEFVGYNSEGVVSETTATVSIAVSFVPFAPTVPTTALVTLASNTSATYTCSYYAGPSPTDATYIFITQVPAKGTLYQYNSTSDVALSTITDADVAAAQALGLPGVLVTDTSLTVFYVPPAYAHGLSSASYAYASFQYVARSAGGLVSPSPCTVTLAVTQVNFPPVVSDGTVTTLQETAVTIYLSDYVLNPSAVDGNTYVCVISALPTSGSLYQVTSTGAASPQPIPVPNVVVTDSLARVIYKPKSGTGQYGADYDAFSFYAKDAVHSVKSAATARLIISVTFVNKPPLAPALTARLYENQGKIIELDASDPEGANVTTFLVSSNLPYGRLFQFVSSGGGLPVDGSWANYSTGGLTSDPEYDEHYTYANYTGSFGGGFDVTPYIGAEITSWPTRIEDDANRLVFLPLVYSHGDSSYDYIYGVASISTSGKFTYIANDGLANTTTPGVVTLKVNTVLYAPITATETVEMDEDSFVVITLPVYSFDPSVVPPCYVLTIPTVGDLYQYDGRNTKSPLAEQILTSQTQVQDVNADGTSGTGRRVVYVPPKLHYGDAFANFSFYATNGLKSDPGMIWIDISPVNHAPTVDSFSVIISGHNSTVPVVFNITDVDYAAVYINITSFPTRGRLWTQSTYIPAATADDYDVYTPVAGTELSVAQSAYYPPAPYFVAANRSRSQTFSLLFDDAEMGAVAISSTCTVDDSDVQCGYTGFTFSVLNYEGDYSEGFVEIVIECGPGYVVNVWQSVGHVCVTCPTGATCAAEGQFMPMADAGYWRGVSSNGLFFVSCLPASACVGTVNSSTAVTDLDAQCAAGYHGRVCAACSTGYYKLNDSCLKCSGSSVFWLVLIGVPVVLVLMWLVLQVSRRGVDLTFFALILSYCQVLAVFAQYHLTWPSSVLTTLTVFSITHLNLDIFAVSCYHSTTYSYADMWKGKMAIIPGLALAVAAMVAILVLMRARCGKWLDRLDMAMRRRNRRANGNAAATTRRNSVSLEEEEGEGATQRSLTAKATLYATSSDAIANSDAADHPSVSSSEPSSDHLRSLITNDPSAGFDANTSLSTWSRYYISLGVRTFTLLLFVAYLPICVKVFQLFNCTSFPDGTRTFDADWSLTCYSDWWYQLRPWGILAVMVYGIGIPMWFGYGLRRTAPPFDLIKWWACLYYPRVRSTEESSEQSQPLLLGATSGPSDISPASATSKKPAPPPPPPSAPPAIPPPSPDLGGSAPYLNAATAHALDRARIGLDEDAAGAKAKLDEDDAAVQAAKEAAWAKSSNLALTSVASSTLTQDQKIARFMFTLVIDPFRDDLFFWFFCILARNFWLAVVSIFFADQPVYQATLALAVLFSYTLASAVFQPYVNPTMNKLEFVTMSCSCLVLFLGFLFVGETDKTDIVFNVVAAVCMLVICASWIFVGQLLFAKLEEIFHCWNCRRLPTVAAPASDELNRVAREMHEEIVAGHNIDPNDAATRQPHKQAAATTKVTKLAPLRLAVGQRVNPRRATPRFGSPSALEMVPRAPVAVGADHDDDPAAPDDDGAATHFRIIAPTELSRGALLDPLNSKYPKEEKEEQREGETSTGASTTAAHPTLNSHP